ncbi:MAG: N-acetyltransferase family protein [Gammaproteobacteria bacterium]
MTIREAVIEDSEAICRLLAELFEQESEFRPDFEAQARGVNELLSNPQMGIFLVIEDKGKIVGAVSLLFVVSTALGGKAALLEDFVLTKHARGKGLGKRLLKHAIQFAFLSGCRRITLMTDQDNLAAQSLYRKMGFSVSTMIPMRLVFENKG